MWAEAAKWLNKFPEAVLTGIDHDGYPVSVRVPTGAYDSATGELPVSLPDAVDGAEGPANLLCHSHDEKLWNLADDHGQRGPREARRRMDLPDRKLRRRHRSWLF